MSDEDDLDGNSMLPGNQPAGKSRRAQNRTTVGLGVPGPLNNMHKNLIKNFAENGIEDLLNSQNKRHNYLKQLDEALAVDSSSLYVQVRQDCDKGVVKRFYLFEFKANDGADEEPQD